MALVSWLSDAPFILLTYSKYFGIDTDNKIAVISIYTSFFDIIFTELNICGTFSINNFSLSGDVHKKSVFLRGHYFYQTDCSKSPVFFTLNTLPFLILNNQNDVGCWEFMQQKPQLYNSQHSTNSISVIFYILSLDIKLGLRMEITDEIFQSFYAEEKIIDSDIIWKRRGDAYITEHIDIINNTINDYPITLICKIDRYKKYAFNIVYRKSQTLVRYDMKKHSPSFKDKCSGQQLIEPHKHKFKKGCPRDLKAKIIPEKEITRNDINKALGQFFVVVNLRI